MAYDEKKNNNTNKVIEKHHLITQFYGVQKLDMMAREP